LEKSYRKSVGELIFEIEAICDEDDFFFDATESTTTTRPFLIRGGGIKAKGLMFPLLFECIRSPLSIHEGGGGYLPSLKR
jgi:hypothetical protein